MAEYSLVPGAARNSGLWDAYNKYLNDYRNKPQETRGDVQDWLGFSGMRDFVKQHSSQPGWQGAYNAGIFNLPKSEWESYFNEQNSSATAAQNLLKQQTDARAAAEARANIPVSTTPYKNPYELPAYNDAEARAKDAAAQRPQPIMGQSGGTNPVNLSSAYTPPVQGQNNSPLVNSYNSPVAGPNQQPSPAGIGTGLYNPAPQPTPQPTQQPNPITSPTRNLLTNRRRRLHPARGVSYVRPNNPVTG